MENHGLLIFVCLCLYWCTSFSQAEHRKNSPQKEYEAGHPFIQYYFPDDYAAFAQNWGAVQDSLGLLYFANGDGVLMYDGVRWKVVTLPKRSHVKSIAIDRHNRVFVGASGEFGYLEAEANGKMNYISLSSGLDGQDKNFTTVWEIHPTVEGVYFRTAEAPF